MHYSQGLTDHEGSIHLAIGSRARRKGSRPIRIECLCNMDPDIRFGGIQMTGDLPVMLKANETKRLMFEFEISDELRELLSRAQLNEQDKLFVRVYTNRSVWKARIERCFGDMEDWFWQTKERLERRNGQPSG